MWLKKLESLANQVVNYLAPLPHRDKVQPYSYRSDRASIGRSCGGLNNIDDEFVILAIPFLPRSMPFALSLHRASHDQGSRGESFRFGNRELPARLLLLDIVPFPP